MIVAGLLLALLTQCSWAIEWKHSAVLDNNFLVLWTPGENDVTFEVQVKTPGYVGFGFTREDGSEGVDMVIGWVDNNGQVHLQVCWPSHCIPFFLCLSFCQSPRRQRVFVVAVVIMCRFVFPKFVTVKPRLLSLCCVNFFVKASARDLWPSSSVLFFFSSVYTSESVALLLRVWIWDGFSSNTNASLFLLLFCALVCEKISRLIFFYSPLLYIPSSVCSSTALWSAFFFSQEISRERKKNSRECSLIYVLVDKKKQRVAQKIDKTRPSRIYWQECWINTPSRFH